MSRRGRKGRVSNELVAASCAAILTVYGAGYWRTRDEARRFETQAQVRRLARPVPAAPAAPVVPLLAESSVAATAPTAPMMPPTRSKPRHAAPKPLSLATTPLAPPVALPEPGKPSAPGIVPAPEQQSVPLPEPVVAAAATAPEPPVAVSWHDGTYTGWGLSRHGDIEARVTIRNGGIVAVGIATCATRYPCYVIDEILQQPLFRQSPDVDRVSRATESSDAYSDAVWQALQKAEAGPATTTATSP